jgi:hypothetical protein
MLTSVSENRVARARPVWQGVSTDSLKFHPGPPYPTLLSPAGGPRLKWSYGRFGGSPPAGRVACSHLLPPWISHAVRAWLVSDASQSPTTLSPVGGSPQSLVPTHEMSLFGIVPKSPNLESLVTNSGTRNSMIGTFRVRH